MRQLTLTIARRWWWLMIAATVIAAGAGYWVAARESLTFEAQARLIVGPGIDSANPDLNALRTGAELMGTYAEVAVTHPVLQAVIDDLQLDTTPDRLRNRLTVRTSTGTQILSIRAVDENADRARDIANAVGQQLVDLSPSGAGSPEALLKAKMRTHAERLEWSILFSEARLDELAAALQDSTDPEEQRWLAEQISQERTRLSESQGTLTNLYAALQEAATNQVRFIEPAIGANLIDSQLRLKVLSGALAGLVLALVIAFGYEYFVSSVESVRELGQAADVPTLGEIARNKTLRGSEQQRLVIEALPRSPAADSYRMLSTKLRYLSHDEPLRSILVVSPHLDHDTGEIAANLAIALVETGSRVILVDANLRQPSIGHLFGTNGRAGLTEMLADHAERPELATVEWAPGLSILPSGSTSNNPFGQLASPCMSSLVRQLEEQADLVILSASSPLPYAESLILAAHVGGVLIVARKGQTPRRVIEEMVANVRLLGGRVIGAVLDNNSPRSWFKLPASRSV